MLLSHNPLPSPSPFTAFTFQRPVTLTTDSPLLFRRTRSSAAPPLPPLPSLLVLSSTMPTSTAARPVSDGHPVSRARPSSPFMALGPDICYHILTFLAAEPLDALTTDGYRRLLPFSICCTQHYNFTISVIRGLAVLPLRFRLRQTADKPHAIPPFPTVLYTMPKRQRAPPPVRWFFRPRFPEQPVVPDVDVVRAVKTLHSLRTLHLYRTTRISDAGLSEILSSSLNLRELRVPANHQITSACLLSLLNCPTLQRIDLSYCRNFGDEAALFFRQMPNLRSLNVAYWNITDRFVRIVCEGASLEQLDISACPELTGTACTHVAQYAKRLEAFNFRCSRLLNDAGALSLSDCPSLRTVDLSLAKEITDEAVVGFGDPVKMPLLQSLRLSNCSLITDRGVSHIAMNTNIRCLDFSFCDSLTDRSVAALSHLTGLEDLDLSGCGHITDEAIADLARLKNLRNVRLAYCPRLTDDCVQHFRSSPSCRFEILDLRSCREVSIDGIKQLEEVSESVLTTREEMSTYP